MQNILKSTISLLVLATIFLIGCSDDKNTPSVLTMSGSSENIIISSDGQTASVTLQPTGSSEEITVKTSGEWQFVEGEVDDWCKITRQGDKIIISADEFPSLYDRNSMSRIKLSDGTSAIIKISQNGTDMAAVKLDFGSLEFTERGGSQTVQVTANRDWVVTGHEGLNWISITAEEGSFIVTTTANNTPADLNALLTVKAGSAANAATADCAVILAKQNPAYITTDIDMVPVSENGGIVNFAVDCNREWNVITTDTWYTATKEGDNIVLNVTPKSQEVIKEGTFKIQTTSGDEQLEKIITVKQFINPMIFEYTASVKDATAVLPTIGDINLHIEWGDGSVDSKFGTLNYQEIEHQYTASGVYEVKVYGVATTLYYSESYVDGEVAPLTALKQWGDLGVTNLDRAFQGTLITKVPAGYKNVMQNATSINNMFTNSDLSEIPADFFEGCSNLTSANSVFSDTNLTIIPVGLLDGLTGLKTAVGMFAYTPITELPAGLFKNQSELTGINTAFKECTLLRTIPENMFVGAPKLTNLIGAFSGCTSIESIPAGLFSTNTEITIMNATFENCTKLTSIPVSLFDNCKKIMHFGYTFSGCTALTGESPYTTIDGVDYHLYERTAALGFVEPTITRECFKGCINLTDYATILSTWK